MRRRPFLVTAVLLPLALLGGWLAPRLQPQAAETELSAEDACFRWRQFECCLVDER